MKVLGSIGNNIRGGGNTDLLVAEILAGAVECGFETEKLYMYPLRTEVCVNCKACKIGFTCVHKDDMAELDGKLEGADVI